VPDEQRAAIVERSLTLSTQPVDAPAVGDRVPLHRLVTNLVDNAIRHNVDGGHLDLRTTSAAGAVTLQVSNGGPVIPADQLGRLLEPFQRRAAPAAASRDSARGWRSCTPWPRRTARD